MKSKKTESNAQQGGDKTQGGAMALDMAALRAAEDMVLHPQHGLHGSPVGIEPGDVQDAQRRLLLGGEEAQGTAHVQALLDDLAGLLIPGALG